MVASRLLPTLRAFSTRPLPMRTIAIPITHRALTTPPHPVPLRPCPKCTTPLPLPTSPCPTCATLLPFPTGLSPHSILHLSSPIPANAAFSQTFDIPLELSLLPSHGYDLDPKDLRQRMLERQKELHPDKFGSKGENEVALARELSGRVNEAFGILVDPLKRAEYILEVHALAVTETDSLTDPGLLAEVLEAREELESAKSSEEVETLRKKNHDKVEATIASIKEAFGSDPPNLAGAKILAVQLKYRQGLEEAAKEWTPAP